MKKFIGVLAILLLVAGTVFANGQQGGASAPAAASSSAIKDPQGNDITVRLLTDASGIDDKSFNAAAWRGILRFYGDTLDNPKGRGSFYDVVTAANQDMYVPNIQQATDEKYSLIVATGFTLADALKSVAENNPDQKYMIVDVDWLGLPNILEAVYAEQEGSYLVGVIAALKAKADGIQNPKFGFIGGVPGSTITKFEVGYIQGILSVIPDAQIVDYYANTWDNPALAKTQAKNWYDSGVYIIYSAAGATGNGTIAQAKEYRTQGKNVWAIGVDSDQYADGLYTDTDSAVLTSMLKKVENSLVYGLNAIKDGSFKGEVIRFDLKSDGVGYATTNTKALTSDITSQVDAVKADIVSGKIKVTASYADSKKLPGFPQNLGAQD
ncbi:MAG: BMP family ABC transporter substrate-binding protein [Spirochaetaceae bacterium]|jgi:basic membrane protein A|nr:BMP family ABC transporter substrate-binding protein [Spirochaetaceae bacterium]